MRARSFFVVISAFLVFAAAPSAYAGKKHENASKAALKLARHDPAFRAGYDRGYRQGANDSQGLSNSYRDQSGAVYEAADAGYTPKYGDRGAYERLFRQGYIAGYKAGWDFNAGQYCALGCGSGGP